MKKKILGAIIVLGLGTLMTGCGNRDVFDTTWEFDNAIILFGEDKIEVEISSWKDYDDTTIQIKSKDGRVYLTDVKNVLMIKE